MKPLCNTADWAEATGYIREENRIFQSAQPLSLHLSTSQSSVQRIRNMGFFSLVEISKSVNKFQPGVKSHEVFTVKQLTVLKFSGSFSLSNSVAQSFAFPLLPGMATFSLSLSGQFPLPLQQVHSRCHSTSPLSQQPHVKYLQVFGVTVPMLLITKYPLR